MPACEAQNPAKRFKPPTFCNWLYYIRVDLSLSSAPPAFSHRDEESIRRRSRTSLRRGKIRAAAVACHAGPEIGGESTRNDRCDQAAHRPARLSRQTPPRARQTWPAIVISRERYGFLEWDTDAGSWKSNFDHEPAQRAFRASPPDSPRTSRSADRFPSSTQQRGH